MFGWLSRRKPPPPSPAPERRPREDRGPRELPALPPTPRARWTVDGIYFDTTGFELTSATSDSMVWKTGAGHSLTLTRAPSDTARPASADLTALRNYARARARQRGSDILSVDPIVTARGAQAIEVIAKRTYGGGFWFEGTLVVSDPDMDYTVTMDIAEHDTGTREALVNAMMFQLGQMEFEPDTAADGSMRIKGWFQDPYDATFDSGALNQASDDRRLDPIIAGHPLSHVRQFLWYVQRTMEFGAGDSPHRSLTTRDMPPRGQVSNAVLYEVCWIAERYDLLEEFVGDEVSARTSAAGNATPFDLFPLTLMAGLAQHAQEKYPEASATFARALAAAEPLGADHPRVGAALALLGRTQNSLGRDAEAADSFGRAVKILERQPGDVTHLPVALQRRHDRAPLLHDLACASLR